MYYLRKDGKKSCVSQRIKTAELVVESHSFLHAIKLIAHASTCQVLKDIFNSDGDLVSNCLVI